MGQLSEVSWAPGVDPSNHHNMFVVLHHGTERRNKMLPIEHRVLTSLIQTDSLCTNRRTSRPLLPSPGVFV